MFAGRKTPRADESRKHESRQQAEHNDSGGKRPPKTEPNDVLPSVDGVPEAEGGAEEPRREVTSAAAKATVTTPAGCPSRAIRRRSKVVVMPTVFRPFPHIAMNLVEPPRIGLE